MEQNGLQSKFLSSCDKTRHHGMSWEDEGFTESGGCDYTWRGSAFCDHYQAVPVSDGWHVLFTEPGEYYQCLWSDAPPGAGTTKMVRRYIFVRPMDEERKAAAPKPCKSGGELRCGKVVVGCGDEWWLLVVPPDGFFRHDKKVEGEPKYEPREIAEWLHVRISGVQFGKVPGLVDIAVDATGSDLTVWAFSIDGMAYVW